MRYRNHLVFKEPEGEKPLFAVGLAVVLDRESKAPEDLSCIRKVWPVTDSADTAFSLIS